MWKLTSRRIKANGIQCRRTGPHAVRHACATRLLQQGASFKQIGDLLGHQSLESVGIYAKVDLPTSIAATHNATSGQQSLTWTARGANHAVQGRRLSLGRQSIPPEKIAPSLRLLSGGQPDFSTPPAKVTYRCRKSGLLKHQPRLHHLLLEVRRQLKSQSLEDGAHSDVFHHR